MFPEKELESLIALVDFFFKYKYFEFNNRFGKRKEGTVMGIKFTPLYAVILMDDLEKEILESLLKKRFWW